MTHDYKPGDWVRCLRGDAGFTYGDAYKVQTASREFLCVYDDDGDYRPVLLAEVEPVERCIKCDTDALGWGERNLDITQIDTPFGLLDEETQERPND